MKSCSKVLLLCAGAFLITCSAIQADPSDIVRANPFVKQSAASQVFAKPVVAASAVTKPATNSTKGTLGSTTITGTLEVDGVSTFKNDRLFAHTSTTNGFNTYESANTTGVFFIQLTDDTPVYIEATDMTAGATIDHVTYLVNPAKMGVDQDTLCTVTPSTYEVTAIAGKNAYCGTGEKFAKMSPSHLITTVDTATGTGVNVTTRYLKLTTAYVTADKVLCIALPCYFTATGAANPFGNPTTESIYAQIKATGTISGIGSLA
jgi:hypothetical protein